MKKREAWCCFCLLTLFLIIGVDGQTCEKRIWRKLGLTGYISSCQFWCSGFLPRIGYEEDGTPCTTWLLKSGTCSNGHCVAKVMDPAPPHSTRPAVETTKRPKSPASKAPAKVAAGVQKTTPKIRVQETTPNVRVMTTTPKIRVQKATSKDTVQTITPKVNVKSSEEYTPLSSKGKIRVNFQPLYPWTPSSVLTPQASRMPKGSGGKPKVPAPIMLQDPVVYQYKKGHETSTQHSVTRGSPLKY